MEQSKWVNVTDSLPEVPASNPPYSGNPITYDEIRDIYYYSLSKPYS